LVATDTPYVSGTSMSIGRIPVTTGSQLEHFTTKLAATEARSPSFAVTLLAGRTDPAGDFPGDMRSIAVLVPEDYFVTTADLGARSFAEVRGEARGAFERGDAVVAWVGHSGVDRIDSSGVLDLDQVAQLPTSQRLPLFAGATCNVNNFSFPGWTAFGPALVQRDGGGAVASWAPVGTSFNENSVPMVRKLMTELFSGNARSLRLGDAIRSVGDSLQGGTLSEFPLWQLLGDPATLVP
jgi:hypothetical protein